MKTTLEFTIRAATVADARVIALIHVTTQIHAYKRLIPGIVQRPVDLENAQKSKREKLLQDRLGDTCTFVAERLDHEIIGFATGGPNREGPSEYDGELYNVFVLPEYQHYRVGSALFVHVIGFLRGKYKKSVLLWVLQNTAAVGFYEKLGGQKIAQREEIAPAAMTLCCYGWKNLDELDTLLRSKLSYRAPTWTARKLLKGPKS
jgi:ribosomal protein S18 acetylase RimI-like enzyme